ncbi:MAG TPA: Mur ligase family protein [Thermoanaerobaculia bacterium]|nr:Mur ligase family protein [Thermoanaerobaculia bacterium]
MNQPRLDIYFIAIGGTGMAPLACLLQEQGHRVRGSDGPLYPPMSDLLAAAGIQPLPGFSPSHLEPRPDLVVVGNAVPRGNVEAQETERLGIPRVSMPEALWRFFLSDRRPLVIAGTHGKTTTTSLAAWVYRSCGADPGYLIGGLPIDLPTSFASGSGPRFIVEGDEYNASYFDRGPKFLHYRPQTLILTSIEYDHADLYPSPELLVDAYRRLISTLPSDGLLIACGDQPQVLELAAGAPCEVMTYGLGKECDLRPASFELGATISCRLPDLSDGERAVTSPLAGAHNLSNMMAVWGAALRDGLEPARVADALSRFRGVHRRLEVVGEGPEGVVIDDFAHHPSAIAATLEALRQRYPERRVLALFEPRSLSAGRRIFHYDYLRALSRADWVGIAPIYHRDRLSDDESLDLDLLCRELGTAGVESFHPAGIEELYALARGAFRSGDVIVTMSSGSFGGIAKRLAESLTPG